MGWERKRGKLHELNTLLRGSTTTGILTTGRAASTPPPDVRYVVTLDADTRLPRGAVGRLVGTIAHPLNQPSFDAKAGRVTQGYGVLQPRITSTLPAEHGGIALPADLLRTGRDRPVRVRRLRRLPGPVRGGELHRQGDLRPRRLQRGDGGPCTRERAPEPRPVRGGLRPGRAGDRRRALRRVPVQLPGLGGPPSTAGHGATGSSCPGSSAGPATPRAGGGALIPGIARWKMVDNLRRTMSAPLTLATLVAAWTLPSVSAGVWTAFVLASVIVPAALPVLAGLLPRRQGISKRSHLRALGEDIALAAAHVGLGFTFLAHQAWLMVDAILRTLARVYATRRNLLEWTTAAQAKASDDLDLAGFYRQMAGGVAIAAATAVLVLAVKPGAAWIAAPFVVLWLLSPLVARWVSLPPPESAAEQLSAADVGALRLTARRTWRFFETFVGPEDHGLPPDNFQDDPRPVVEHRTSPTNIGMYLLATVTARDFGWIGTLEMVERLEATLATIGQPRAVPRAPVQLVRHARPAPARARVRVVGRQWQSRRPPARAVQRLPPDDRPAASGRGRAGRDRRRDRADPRGCRRDRRRPEKPDAHPAAPRRSPRAARRGQLRRPRDARGLGGPPGRALRARPDAVGRRRGPHRRAGRGPGWRARDLGRGGPASRQQPCPGSRAAPAPSAGGRPSRRSPSCPIRRTGSPARDRRPRRCSFDGSRRSPTRPSSSSGRWTSASCSTRPASSSRSGSGSGTARWIRATTTSSPPRPASRASSRSPRGMSRRTTGSGSAAR